ncbi:ribonuclease T [Candidatus Tachikawaea gelatinosa]|uniref:Ribonuclease T n=1 Tax=Candidatus Tachikawaea gelatinosa TaxID=1410383 RepID=A0A090AQL6_9ENTR|nr:ribonuclease T [Candidatus Tachikawaea gelatinosa]BAP58637.1 ribonuclease T [Candidatus Tachikawaea gelatinosa]
MSQLIQLNKMNKRFRGFYPVVVDIETAGFNETTDALLEIGIITLKMDEEGWLHCKKMLHFHIKPFKGASLQSEALSFTGIDPYNPFRSAIQEYDALNKIFAMVQQEIDKNQCNRAIIVAHNAAFDHKFLMAATQRSEIKNNPFHPFSTFDTAALSGLVFGQTVLSKACLAAGINFDNNKAHSALYDTQQTANLFCVLVNKWKRLGGWPLLKNDTYNKSNKVSD